MYRTRTAWDRSWSPETSLTTKYPSGNESPSYHDPVNEQSFGGQSMCQQPVLIRQNSCFQLAVRGESARTHGPDMNVDLLQTRFTVRGVLAERHEGDRPVLPCQQEEILSCLGLAVDQM